MATMEAEQTMTQEEAQAEAMEEKILWSSITRNGTILVEAGDDPFNGAVSQTAHGILSKKNTPGFEFHTLKNGDGWFGRKSVTSSSTRKSVTSSSTNNDMAMEEEAAPARMPRLKAVKFHVYEHNDLDDQVEAATGKENQEQGEPIVWVFAAVYNPEASSWAGSKHMLQDVQSFLEKIVGLTDMPRSTDPVWRTGGTLACQATFAPILLQRMQEVTYLGRVARLHESLEGATELMQSNITAIMDREEQLKELDDKGSKLQDMATVFKKNTTGVRRRMMMQNAKHGVILGTAITAGVAVCVVPPLIAIL